MEHIEQEPLDYRLIQQLQAKVAQRINIEAQGREARGERELSRDDEQQMALALIHEVVAENPTRPARSTSGCSPRGWLSTTR